MMRVQPDNEIECNPRSFRFRGNEHADDAQVLWSLFHIYCPHTQGQYYSTKAFVCCNIPNFASYMWVWSVTLGWLSFVQVLACFGQIAILDRNAEGKRLCSCACIRPFMPWGRQPDKRAADLDGKKDEMEKGMVVEAMIR